MSVYLSNRFLVVAVEVKVFILPLDAVAAQNFMFESFGGDRNDPRHYRDITRLCLTGSEIYSSTIIYGFRRVAIVIFKSVKQFSLLSLKKL